MYGKRQSTKNRKPHLTEYFIRREKLVQKVDHADKKIIVLCAPSGCGKTIFMDLYGETFGKRQVWYRLEESDNDISIFLDTLAAALREAVPELSFFPELPQEAEGLKDRQEEDGFFRNMGRELALALAEALDGERLCVMLDDSWNLKCRKVLSVLSGFSEGLPDGARLLVSARDRIPCFVLKALAAGEVLILSWEDLAFTLEEMEQILVPVEREGLEDLADRIYAFMKGWPAGVLLLYQYLKDKKRNLVQEGMKELCQKAQVYDFIMYELFQELSSEMRQFLMAASVLDTLDAGCAGAIGNINGKELQGEALSAGLFLQRDEGGGQSCQLLPVFRCCFLRQMDEREKRKGYSAAARYYLAAGYAGQAAEYAIRAHDGEAFSLVVEQEGEKLLKAEDHETMERWNTVLDAMEKEDGSITPGALFVTALYWKALGKLERAWEYLECALKKAEDLEAEDVYTRLLIKKIDWKLEEGKGREAEAVTSVFLSGSHGWYKNRFLIKYARLKCLVFCGAFSEARILARKLLGGSMGTTDSLEEDRIKQAAGEIFKALAAGSGAWNGSRELTASSGECPEAWNIGAAFWIIGQLDRFLTNKIQGEGTKRALELAESLEKELPGSFFALTGAVFTGLWNLREGNFKNACKALTLAFRLAPELRMDRNIFTEEIRDELYRLLLAYKSGYQGIKGEFSLFVSCFGSFRAVILETGEEIGWRSRKARECMALLALNGTRAFTREEMMSILWDGDRLPANEVAAFHNLLSSIRKSLSPWGLSDLLVFDGKRYSLRPGKVYTEVSQGEELADAIMAGDRDRLMAMEASLFRFASRPFLLKKGTAWATERRDFYEIWFARGLVLLGEIYQKKGRTEDAILAFQKALELSPYLEPAQTGFLIAFGSQNDAEKLRRAYKRICALFEQDMEEIPESLTKIYKDIMKNVRKGGNPQKHI